MNIAQIFLLIYAISVSIGLLVLLRDYIVTDEFKVKDAVSILFIFTPIINAAFAIVFTVIAIRTFIDYIGANGERVLFSRNKK